jgi:hypothetical protein
MAEKTICCIRRQDGCLEDSKNLIFGKINTSLAFGRVIETED